DRRTCYNRALRDRKPWLAAQGALAARRTRSLVVDAGRIRLAAALIGVVLALGVPSALGQSAYEQQASIETRISGLRDDIAAAKAKEGTLTTEIEAAGQRIDAITGDVDSLNSLIAQLESELAAHRAKLERLEAQFDDQTRDYEHL